MTEPATPEGELTPLQLALVERGSELGLTREQAERYVRKPARSTAHPSVSSGPPDPSSSGLDLEGAAARLRAVLETARPAPGWNAARFAAAERDLADLVAEVRRLDRDLAETAMAFASVSVERDQLRDELEKVTAERNIAVNTAVARTPDFDVVAMRIACDQREAADRRAQALQATVARVEALVAHARKVSPSESMNVAVGDLEAALRGATGERAGHGAEVHACPPEGSGLMPCCGRPPFELPRGHRIAGRDASLVTCTGKAGKPEPPTCEHGVTGAHWYDAYDARWGTVPRTCPGPVSSARSGVTEEPQP